MSRMRALYDVGARLGKVLTRRGWPLHCNEQIEPFFIIGAGRSGTTLLRRMLVASEQVHIPPETYVLAQVIEYYRRNAYQDWESLVLQCLALFELHPEFHTFHISLRPLLPRLYSLPEQERSLARMLDMFYRFHAEQISMACSRWGDKTPVNTFALDAIYEVFPRAQFIHLLRDGVDVVHSCMKRGLVPRLEDAAARWQRALHEVQRFAQKQPQACRELRYEALVQQPDIEMSALCEWLGIDYHHSMLDERGHTAELGDMDYAHYASSLKALSCNYIGAGRRELKHEELQKLEHLIGPALQTLGYPKASGED